MSKFLDAIKKGFNEGRQKAKAESSIRRKGNAIIIVFETSGEVKLATLCGDLVCRENLTAYRQCPQELLDGIPSEIVAFCKAAAPHYLYLVKADGDLVWETTTDPVKI